MTATHPHLNAGDTFTSNGNRSWTLCETPRATTLSMFGRSIGETFEAMADYVGIGGPAVVLVRFPITQKAA